MPTIGPNFANELLSAGCVGCSFSPDGEINFPDGVTDQQKAAVKSVLGAHAHQTPNANLEVRKALTLGVALASASAPALNATYACDADTHARITAEAVNIRSTGGAAAGQFTNGLTTKPWPDIAGATHTFNLAQFLAFSQAVSRYIDALNSARSVALSGAPWTWNPPASALAIP